MFSEARAKQTRFPDVNANSFKRIAMKANPAPQAAESVLYSRFHPFKKQGRNKNLSKHRSSPKDQKTPPSKDKSISGRRADGFEGRLGPCLR